VYSCFSGDLIDTGAGGIATDPTFAAQVQRQVQAGTGRAVSAFIVAG
jgi:hypothetical protein